MENEPTKFKLWQPVIIMLVAVILTYPPGALLAAINARHLGEKGKQIKYILTGILYMLIFWTGGLFMMSSTWFSVLTFVMTLALAYMLYRENQEMIRENLAVEDVTYQDSRKVLIVIVGAFVAIGACFFLFAVLMMTFNSQ